MRAEKLIILLIICLLACLSAHTQSATTDCQPGTFGTNCTLDCSLCYPQNECRTDEGCTKGCIKGSQNFPFCNETCSQGWFGFNCSADCHCNGECDRFNGFCFGNCTEGWTGDDCQILESSSSSSSTFTTATTPSTSSTATTSATPSTSSTATTSATPSTSSTATTSATPTTNSDPTVSESSTDTSTATSTASTKPPTQSSQPTSTETSTEESTASTQSSEEATDSTSESSTAANEAPPLTTLWVLIAISAGLVSAAAFALVLLLLKRRRRRRSEKKFANLQLPKLELKVPATWQLWSSIFELKQNRRLLIDGSGEKEVDEGTDSEQMPALTFEEEFGHLPVGQLRPVTRQLFKDSGWHGDNWPDNRFVELNACRVRGYLRRDAFVSAESPTDEESAARLWQLVISESASQVVAMDTGGYRYWPEVGQTRSYGDAAVTCVSSTPGRFYSLSTLLVNHQTVYHRHLTQRLPLAYSAICTAVQACRRIEDGPVFVHSHDAGGRGCLLIALDWLTQQFSFEGSASPYRCCLDLRKQRPNALSQAHLYAQLYDSLFESVICIRQRVLLTQESALAARQTADAQWQLLQHLPPPQNEFPDEDWPGLTLMPEPHNPAEFWRRLPDVQVVISTGSGLWRGEGDEFQCGDECKVKLVQNRRKSRRDMKEVLVLRRGEPDRLVLLGLAGDLFGSSDTPKSAWRLQRLVAKAKPKANWLLVGPVDRCCLLAACKLAANQIDLEGFVDIVHLLRWMRLLLPTAISSAQQLQCLLRTLRFDAENDPIDLDSTYESVYANYQLPVIYAANKQAN